MTGLKNKIDRRLGRWLMVLAVSALIAGLFLWNTEKQEQKNYEVHEISAKGEVYSATAHVRSGPGTEYEKIGTIKKESSVIITGYAYDTVQTMWYRIQYNKKTGFVRHDLIVLPDA